MKSQNFTTTISVDQTPEEAFAAINNVRGWWSGEIEGNTSEPGDEFTYRYKDIHYSKQKLVEVVPAQKVVWQIVDAYLQFTADKKEWVGTRVTFEVSRHGDKTEVRFTHDGLTPESECYDACSNAWGFYIRESLRNLIASGTGSPNLKEQPAG